MTSGSSRIEFNSDVEINIFLIKILTINKLH